MEKLGWSKQGIMLALDSMSGTKSNKKQSYVLEKPQMFENGFPIELFSTMDTVTCSMSEKIGCNMFPVGTDAACVQQAKSAKKSWVTKMECPYQMLSASTLLQKGLLELSAIQFQKNAAMMLVQVNKEAKNYDRKYGEWVRDWCDNWEKDFPKSYLAANLQETGKISVEFVGGEVTGAQTKKTLGDDMEKMDIMVHFLIF